MRHEPTLPVGAATRGNVLASLLVIAERSLTVAQLATTELWRPDESAPAQQVAAEMKTLGYDGLDQPTFQVASQRDTACDRGNTQR